MSGTTIRADAGSIRYRDADITGLSPQPISSVNKRKRGNTPFAAAILEVQIQLHLPHDQKRKVRLQEIPRSLLGKLDRAKTFGLKLADGGYSLAAGRWP